MGNNIEQKTKIKRSENLIAEFTDNFAENWFMAVGEQFRNELDIKKTKRIKNKQQVEIWTQGSAYNFKEGQVFYDTPSGYSTWSNAIKKITFACQIREAEPKTSSTENNAANDGFVNFTLYKTNKEKTKIIAIGQHKLSQDEFVEFLKTGEINGRKVNPSHG